MIIDRPAYIHTLLRYKDKDLIKVITGVRRCGKSVLLFDIYADFLVKSGIPEQQIIKVNLENDISGELRDSKKLYAYINEQRTENARYYVMIDEIQYIENFEDLVNSLKNQNCDVYITGSNSKMLSGDIATSLRGRSIEIKVYPLSFAEIYSFAGGDKRTLFNQYMLYGGFPYVITEENEQSKIEYLQMLESTVATKDIIDRYKLRNPQIFAAVYDFLCSNIGALISAKKISDTLRSNGYKTVTPDTVGNYLDYLCESYLFYKVYRYDIKGKEYLKTLNKYYISDIGLRNAHMNYRQLEPTHAVILQSKLVALIVVVGNRSVEHDIGLLGRHPLNKG